MAFLRRLIGGGSRDEHPALEWFDVPPSGSFEVAGVVHHKRELAKVVPPIHGEPETRETTAILRRDPENQYDHNAVEVLIAGELVGFVPRRSSEAWASFLLRLEREGRTARASARVWVGENAWFITLHARPHADYRTPAEEAVYQQEHAESEAAKAHRRAAREQAVRSREESAALADRRRAAGVCASCGQPIERKVGQRGRPAILCADCREQGSRVPRAPKQATASVALEPVAAKPVAEPVPESVPPVVWRRTTAKTDWAVIDLETTGLLPRSDRVVEIAVLRLAHDGREIETWTTLVDPERDMSAARFHGLSAADVRGAPPFREIAPDVLGLISDARLVAHNARFDLNFLGAEMGRVGMAWDGASAFCTMSVPYRLGLVTSRRLEACCEELRILVPSERSAAGNARASAGILRATLGHARDLDLFAAASVAPAWSRPMPPARTRLRTDPPPPRVPTALAWLADRVDVMPVADLPQGGTLSYLELLDRVLEDRQIADEEVRALAAVAEEWQMPTDGVRQLHASYLRGVWELARADGVVTDAELRDLEILSELLGVSVEAAAAAPRPSLSRREDLCGMSVCFTGDSVCTIGGAFLSREDQERMAEEAGLVVKTGVSTKLDILVLADPDSKSGKSRKADELRVRKTAEPVFWRALGVTID